METLIVESLMDASQSGEHAWILPVPSRPTRLGAIAPGLPETLRHFYGPQFNDEKANALGPHALALFWGLLVAY